MIRSLGSSLLAKAGTGSLTRKKEEARIEKPEVPGKGAVGTAGRELVQETDIQPVAPGSEKIIRSAPGIESASLPGIAANQVPLVAGVGMPNMQPQARPGADGQAMFQGQAPAQASETGQGGRVATTGAVTGSPVGSVAQAKQAQAAEAARVLGAQTNVQAERTPFTSAELPNIGIFGSRVSAGGGEEAAKSGWQPTTAQYILGSIGKALNIPSLQTYGGSQTVAAAGKGSVEKAVQNISGALRSVLQAANPVQNVKSGWNKLRSKLGF